MTLSHFTASYRRLVIILFWNQWELNYSPLLLSEVSEWRIINSIISSCIWLWVNNSRRTNLLSQHACSISWISHCGIFAFHSSGGHSKCFWLSWFHMRCHAALGFQFAILISSINCQIGKKRWDKNIPLDDFRSYFSTCALALKLSKRLICALLLHSGVEDFSGIYPCFS